MAKRTAEACEEVYTDLDEKKRIAKTIEYFEKKGHRHFAEAGRGAEITVDLVLQARAKMSENKINGPERCSCKRDDKEVAPGEDPHNYEVFSGTLHGARWTHRVRGRL